MSVDYDEPQAAWTAELLPLLPDTVVIDLTELSNLTQRYSDFFQTVDLQYFIGHILTLGEGLIDVAEHLIEVWEQRQRQKLFPVDLDDEVLQLVIEETLDRFYKHLEDQLSGHDDLYVYQGWLDPISLVLVKRPVHPSFEGPESSHDE
jgi:hypothetical protein